ncbi:hypothetical protein J2T07_001476 [Luteibacter jiangsuensis]|uniref:Lipoprotein n=1 Tax=Luteibacter jiangsuensis TaxID=637577 RepID=A0ABT9SWC6_9GAMM|nr:hypothetical protein [Luteibacter jiangsuensis]MDQ0009299.1 hypothetical protein [Luteibacter jiangsuensis]
MRYRSRFLWPALALLAGCASTTAPVAVTPPAAPISVSCTEDALSEQPCVAMARQKCNAPTVDTIQLILAAPVAVSDGTRTKQRYDYRATYNCPVSVTSADAP